VRPGRPGRSGLRRPAPHPPPPSARERGHDRPKPRLSGTSSRGQSYSDPNNLAFYSSFRNGCDIDPRPVTEFDLVPWIKSGRHPAESVNCSISVTPLTHKSHIRSYAVQGFARGNRLKEHQELSRLNPASTTASLLPTATHSTLIGLTYLPRIHTYIEIHISPPCSNPRSAPPPRRGAFCCGGSSKLFRRIHAVWK
jgi:hypothetical protein